MSKYITIFSLSWQNEFVYRVNFLLWRLRNILRFLMTFFLWSSIFLSSRSVFGYSQEQMLTYVFMVLIVSAIVLSSPSADNIGGEIGSGNLSNYLVKPINYLKYWFTRDLSSKVFNLMFSIVEISILIWIFKPNLLLPNSLINLLGFLVIAALATIIYYFVNVSSRLVAFWTPENTWPFAFLILVIIEVTAGGIFPLDILPDWLQTLLQFTPFPYLLYFPVAIFVNKISGVEILRIIIQAAVWVIILNYITQFVWRKGLVTYSSEGR
ncbi:ABC-2 family transporter protein [Candidatus Daviesbacteria bacterium]|nr:ABC-2 family transporter protein [Candidatus Daviesbacteria bacterium]